jgi:type II secretory pathway component PulM
MNIANNLANWFSGLQPRERLIIKIGAGLLAVAAIYMALLPAMQKNTDLEQRYKRLNADMQWLREQVEVVDRLGSNCAGQAIQSGKKKDVITRIVRRNQLKLLGLQQGDTSSYSLSVSGPSPNRLLQLVYQLTCQGLMLNALDVRSSAGAKATYAADLEVSYVE